MGGTQWCSRVGPIVPKSWSHTRQTLIVSLPPPRGEGSVAWPVGRSKAGGGMDAPMSGQDIARPCARLSNAAPQDLVA